ncbi:MDR family MFS transporter [Rubricoccus marinus]|nr:MFS transporter [Rubricoccus marinus]
MLSGYPRAFWVLFAGTFVNRLGLVVLPFLTLYLTGERGASIEQATLVVSLYGAGAFAAGPIGGALSDRFGRRAVLIGSLVGGAALMAGMPLVQGYWPLAGLVLAFGLVGEMYRPAVSAAVSDLVPPERFARAFSLLYWAINLGVAFGPALGGVLAERVGYTALFAVDAASMVIYAVAIFFGVPETKPLAEEAGGAEDEATLEAAPRARGLADALRDPALLGLAIATLGVGIAFMQAFATLPLAMEADGLSERLYGFAVMVNGLVVVAFSLPVARWAETRLGPGLLASAVATIGVGVGMHALADSFWGHAAAVAVWSLGEIAFIPLVPAIVARLAPEALRGTYQGVQQSGWGLSKMLGPALGGLILAQLGDAALWGSGLALALVVAAVILALRLGAPNPDRVGAG